MSFDINIDGILRLAVWSHAKHNENYLYNFYVYSTCIPVCTNLVFACLAGI